MRSEQLQPSTLWVKLAGYDPKSIDIPYIEQQLQIEIDNHRLPACTVARKVAHALPGGSLCFHIPTPDDCNTSAGKTRLEIAARRDALQIITFLRTCKGLSNLRVSAFSVECGVRETNRVLGEYVITADDYINGVCFDDAVCYAFYPIDLHIPPYNVKQVFFKENVCATVPYRALIPKGSQHLLVAGRIVSSDTDANSALRVQAPCMAEGQAAGCAAAIAAKQNIPVSKVDYEQLVRELKRQGAIVPNR